MTLEEFSSGFDTQLNSFAHAAQFGDDSSKADIVCDEYEKSVFLTKAQEEIALGLYNGKNPLGEAFEGSEEVRRYLAKLITEIELEPITNSSGNLIGVAGSNSYFFTLPNGSNDGEAPLWFITYEAVIISNGKCENTTSLEVIPVRQDEYHKIKKNPFRGANDRRALRLDLSEDVVEIVSNYTVTKYYVRYLRKLNPIILVDLDGNNIGGKTTATSCELPDILHQKILERAVAMAYMSKAQPTQQTNK